MDQFKNLSGLTKANVVALLLFAILLAFGQLWLWRVYVIVPYALALLVGQSITTALNDVEADEPMPLWMRAATGYGFGVILGVGVILAQYFITDHLRYLR